MEALALGEIGLALDYFYNLTPRQFHNTEKGYYEKENNRIKDHWSHTRKLMWATLAPNIKNLKEHEVISFPWDQEEQNEFTAEDQALLLTEVEKVKAFYEKVDAKKLITN